MKHLHHVVILWILCVFLVGYTVGGTGGIQSDGSITSGTLTECIMLEADWINCKTVGGCSITDEAGDNFDYTTADFATDADDQGDWTFGVPDNIAGTTFTVQIYWTSNEAACDTENPADTVCWVVSSVGKFIFANWDAANTSGAQGVDDVCDGEGLLNVADMPDPITHAWSPNQRAVVRVIRDVDASHADCDVDTYVGSANILHMKVCYEVNNVFSGE